MYYRDIVGVPLDKNYPPIKDLSGSSRLEMMVRPWSAMPGNVATAAVVQEITTIGQRGSTYVPSVKYIRQSNGEEWSSWRVFAPQRIATDNNGFKQVYAWDDTNNTELPIGGSGGMGDPATLDVKLDLNTLTASGSYSNGIGVTTAQNYPVSGVAGLTQVRRINGQAGLVHQEWTPFPHDKGLNLWARGTYVRMLNTSTWSSWNFIPMQRVDNIAGRAIYTWDDTNNREQLIYGDTGMRDISASLLNGWKADNIRIRRVGSTVTLSVWKLDPATKTDTFAYVLPAGFGPAGGYNGSLAFIVRTTGSSVGSLLITAQTKYIQPEPAGISFGAGGIGLISWTTDDPWPTSLPGTAVGTIPNL